MFRRSLLHLVFWLLAWCMTNLLFGYGELFNRYSLYYSSIILFIAAGVSYWIIFNLIPKFLLPGRYVLFIVYLLFTIIVSLDFELVTTWLFIIFLEKYRVMTFFHDTRGIYSLLSGTYFIVFLAVAIKLFEFWYREQHRKQKAIKEKIEAELKLLKSQIHPHFLFNTLNNIYSLALHKSDQAPDAVLKLSGLLDYLIYHGENENVSLKKETDLIRNYLDLETLRYGERLVVDFKVVGDVENTQIAPLLLIPLVENAFKHGISKSRSSQKLLINLEITGKKVVFYIENSVPSMKNDTVSGGMGLTNLKARLDLLYKEKYTMDIIETDNIYSVRLKLET